MPINIALPAFDVCALIAVIGLVACLLAVLPDGGNTALQRGVLRLLGVAIALLTLSSIGILVSRTHELTGGWGHFLENIGLALTLTHYGHIWQWRIPAVFVLWAAWLWTIMRHRHQRIAWGLMLLAALLVALTRSTTGHPADHGDFTASVWVDWVHLSAAGLWVGSLFGMSLAVFPRLLRLGNTAGDIGAAIFQRLSTLSGIALALVLAAGIYTATHQLTGFSDLWTSRYGIVLDVKVFIVLVMIAIGAHNRYVKLPRLLRITHRRGRYSPVGQLVDRIRPAVAMTPAAAVQSCARAVLAESLLGLAVIAAASVLLHNMPPADMPSHTQGRRTVQHMPTPNADKALQGVERYGRNSFLAAISPATSGARAIETNGTSILAIVSAGRGVCAISAARFGGAY